jgi:hypothetical protein
MQGFFNCFLKAKLPGVQVETLPLKDFDNTPNKVNPKDLVRTDASEQKIEKFFGTPVEKGKSSTSSSKSRQSQGMSASLISKVTK